MNRDVWHKIFKDYVESWNAIGTLYKNDIIDDEVALAHEHDLLNEIIETMKSEIEK